MSNKLAITTDGKHQLGTKAYLTVNGKHQKIRKMYKTINGKHELCYTSGTAWKKFSCNRSSYTSYVQDDKNVGATSTTTKNNSGTTSVYWGYTFSSSTGFSGTSRSTVDNDMLGGWYSVSTTSVRAYSGTGSTDTTTTYELTTVASASAYTSVYYSKGSTSYGEVYSENKGYPDANLGYTYVTTFTEGGVQYTVMRDGSTYYCYCLA